MRSVITMSLPAPVKQTIDTIAQNEHLPRSQVIQLALNEYFTQYQFRRLRKRLISKAQQQGVYTDEDVFTAVS